MNLDFSKLVPIATPNPRAEYDLRISKKTGKLTVGENAVVRFGLEKKGLLAYPVQNGDIIVSVQEEQYSNMLVSRKEGAQKSRSFTGSVLFDQLSATGFETFRFESVGQHEGRQYLRVVPMGEASITPAVQEEVSTTVNRGPYSEPEQTSLFSEDISDDNVESESGDEIVDDFPNIFEEQI